MPPGSINFWNSLRMDRPLPVNPKYDPKQDDGTRRYRTVQYHQKCVARCEGRDAITRQQVRNRLRWTDPISCAGEADQLTYKLRAAGLQCRLPDAWTQAKLSEWLSTALRHKPFHDGGYSRRFCDCVRSFDEYDGWVEIPDLIRNWPPESQPKWHDKFLEHVHSWLFDKHLAYQVLVILKVCEVVDHKTGMQKNRLHVKKTQHCQGGETCYYLRASNGHTHPGPKCPESLYSPVTDLPSEGAPQFFMHGTKWACLPGILQVGLSFSISGDSQC